MPSGVRTPSAIQTDHKLPTFKVGVLDTTHLTGGFDRYPLTWFPEWTVHRKGGLPRNGQLNPLDPGDVPFAAPQHQPFAVQEIRWLGRPFVAVNTNVVDRHATFADGAPRAFPTVS